MSEGTVKTLGSPAVCVESGGKEDATAEQIKVCASIHLTLDLHMFMNPAGLFINPAARHSTIAGTSRGRWLAPLLDYYEYGPRNESFPNSHKNSHLGSDCRLALHIIPTCA